MARDNGRKSQRAPGNTAEPGKRYASFHETYWEDLAYWVDNDPRIAARLIRLTRETLLNPVEGIGKPKRLKNLDKTWSRRITDEHRLIYRVTPAEIEFLQARFHYA